ncbi:MAG: hypothetical protein RRA35_06385 [Desulfomonilia bacterium]|nr:hypothetical protein [Desulfomonilia bacterium]
MKKVCLLIMVFSFVALSTPGAQEFPSIYKGIRPMGMGGAFTALSNDATALFYNPAGLAAIKERRTMLFPLEVGLGRDAYDFYDEALDVDFDSTLETTEFLRNYAGDYAHASFALFPNHARPNFAFGLIAAGRSNLQVRDRLYPRLITDMVADAGVCAGYARSILGDRISLGGSLKYLFRQSLNEEYTVVDITTDDFEDRLEDDVQEGSGILLDLGLIYKVHTGRINATDVTLQVGMSANNLIGNKLGDAQDLHNNVSIGFAALTSSVAVTVDYVDLLNQFEGNDDFATRLRFGVEYALPKYATLRTGFYQGYLTMGLTLKASIVQLDLLTYAEEVGAYSGQRSDRRYVLGLSFGR